MSDRLLRYSPLGVKPADIIEGLFDVVFPDATTVVDLTPGKLKFWKSARKQDVTFSPHDFTALPYGDRQFDVAVFDGPHLSDLGADSIMRDFGTYPNGDLEGVIVQGCKEAWRVARIGIIVKVTDHVHGQRFVYESGWVINTLGVPYEIVHGRHRQIEDGRWKEPACSARSNGSVYLAYRKGDQKHKRRTLPKTGKTVDNGINKEPIP